MADVDYKKKLIARMIEDQERAARQDDPEFRASEREDRRAISENSARDYRGMAEDSANGALAAALAKSSAQIGTIDGHQADSSAVGEMSDRLDRSRSNDQERIDRSRANYQDMMAKNEGARGKRREIDNRVLEYMAGRQEKTEAAQGAATLRKTERAEDQARQDKRDQATRSDRATAQTNALEDRKLRREEIAGQRDRTHEFRAHDKLDRNAREYSEVLARSGIPSAVGQVEQVYSLLPEKGDVPGYGQVAGMLPDAITSQKGEDLRQAVTTLFNIELKDRSGAAVTDQELNRLKKEFGQGTWKSGDQLRKGVAQYEARLKDVIRNIEGGADPAARNEYQARGGRNFPGFTGRGAPKPEDGEAIAGPEGGEKSLDDMTDEELKVFISGGGTP